MRRGHDAATVYLSSCDMPVFAKKFFCGDKFCPAGLNSCVMKQGQMTSINISHHLHSSCKLFPLQHRNEPISASCVPACVLSLQHEAYAYTPRGLFPLYVPTACLPVCADLYFATYFLRFIMHIHVFFSRTHVMGTEYCSTLAEGDTSHGYCNRKEWPIPFSWLKYLGKSMLKQIVHHALGTAIRSWKVEK